MTLKKRAQYVRTVVLAPMYEVCAGNMSHYIYQQIVFSASKIKDIIQIAGMHTWKINRLLGYLKIYLKLQIKTKIHELTDDLSINI